VSLTLILLKLLAETFIDRLGLELCVISALVNRVTVLQSNFNNVEGYRKEKWAKNGICRNAKTDREGVLYIMNRIRYPQSLGPGDERKHMKQSFVLAVLLSGKVFPQTYQL